MAEGTGRRLHLGWQGAPAQAPAPDPLPSWNDGPAKQAIMEFVERVTEEGGPDFVPVEQRIADLRQRRHAVGRAADLLPVRLRAGSGQGAGAGAPGVAGHAAVQGGARGRPEGAGGSRREGAARDPGGDPCRHDDRGVLGDRRRLARHRPPSAFRAALHRARLSADARAARLSARGGLQDLHRLGRRGRVHARLRRAGLRHPARAGGRLLGRGEVRDGSRTASRS